MPVVHFYLCDEFVSQERCTTLLETASAEYARILESPLDRVRAFIHLHKPWQMAVGGTPPCDSSNSAPFFEAIVLQGRPASQRETLIAKFSEMLAEILQVPQAIVRGRVIQVAPEDWCIAGRTAAEIRKDEIARRKTDAG